MLPHSLPDVLSTSWGLPVPLSVALHEVGQVQQVEEGMLLTLGLMTWVGGADSAALLADWVIGPGQGWLHTVDMASVEEEYLTRGVGTGSASAPLLSFTSKSRHRVGLQNLDHTFKKNALP